MSHHDDDLHGLLAEYETPSALVAACKKVRDAGYAKWDTFTPFPIHGIEKAMGIRMTGLPWIVLAAALVGLGSAVGLQWWTNAVDYKFISSGKPMWSIPASVPVYFELTVLFSAFAALFGMLILNNLPQPSHPLDHLQAFGRVTDDRFFLYIEKGDAKFDLAETQRLLDGTHPVTVDAVNEDRRTSDQLPKPLVLTAAVIAVLALVPFAFIAKARATKTDKPKIHAMGRHGLADQVPGAAAEPAVPGRHGDARPRARHRGPGRAPGRRAPDRRQGRRPVRPHLPRRLQGRRGRRWPAARSATRSSARPATG
jgi:hypothetical protein